MTDLKDAFATLEEMIRGIDSSGTDDQTGNQPEPERHHQAPDIAYATQMPSRYREAWERPTDAEWIGRFGIITNKVISGGIVGLIGPRGRGKTRFAAEAVRDYAPQNAIYTTAMEVFLRCRASFDKGAAETELAIVAELAKARLLVIDELQERGNSSWEDRLLTHIIDKRYSNKRPTIIIANLTADALAKGLGESIVSRMMECGGIIEVTGKSHRVHS